MHVEWDEENPDRVYDSDLTISAHDRSFLLTDIVTAVSQSRAPLIKVSADANQETLMTLIKLKIQVHNLAQLTTLIANLRKVESVISVERAVH
jgi:guanosine-3',5'-bis(diphosphate) 3'-pyrophosphohydrolase